MPEGTGIFLLDLAQHRIWDHAMGAGPPRGLPGALLDHGCHSHVKLLMCHTSPASEGIWRAKPSQARRGLPNSRQEKYGQNVFSFVNRVKEKIQTATARIPDIGGKKHGRVCVCVFVYVCVCVMVVGSHPVQGEGQRLGEGLHC